MVGLQEGEEEMISKWGGGLGGWGGRGCDWHMVQNMFKLLVIQ